MCMKKLSAALALFLLFPLALSACGEAEIVVPETLRVVSTQPSNGAINILPGTPVTIAFSAPIAKEETPGKFFVITLGDTSIGSVVSYNQNNSEVVIKPTENGGKFKLDTMYEVTINSAIPSQDGEIKPLPAAVKFRFRTAKSE